MGSRISRCQHTVTQWVTGTVLQVWRAIARYTSWYPMTGDVDRVMMVYGRRVDHEELYIKGSPDEQEPQTKKSGV